MSDNILDRIEAAKAKVAKAEREKIRLTTQLESLRAQYKETQEQIKTDFGCSVAELPALIETKESELAKLISDIETMLAPATEG